MEEKDYLESNEETRARGVKRSSDIKIAEVTTSKKKRAKKTAAEAPEPAREENNLNDQEEQNEKSAKRDRMFEAVADVAEGRISIEELTVALNNAVRVQGYRQMIQRCSSSDQDDVLLTERDMAAFNRSAIAIARNRERAAAWRRDPSPLLSSNIINNVSNNSVEAPVPSSPIAEPLLLGSSPALSTMTPRCATEPPDGIFNTTGAYAMHQAYNTPSSNAQATHGQRQAARDTPTSPAQPQYQPTISASISELNSTAQQPQRAST